MAQASSSLPGIVTDQPEIFEHEPALSDDTGVNDLDLNTEPADEAISVVEVPIKQAFSYFAERENEIAKFYVQRYGEYKISGSNKPEEETDIEKYHRLVSEVNELLNKFQTSKRDKSELDEGVSLGSSALANNLDILAKQLKALEFAANDGSLEPTQSGLLGVKSRLEKLNDKLLVESDEKSSDPIDDTGKLMRMSALERRLNLLETVLGHNEAKEQEIFKMTNCESLVDAADTLGTWLSLFKPESVQRVSREIDILTQRLEGVSEQASKVDNTKLEQLYNMLTATDKYRAMVPTIIHRLNSMEELQQRSAQISTTLCHLEQVQAEIVQNMQANKEDVGDLKVRFEENLKILGDISKDIDARIASIRDR